MHATYLIGFVTLLTALTADAATLARGIVYDDVNRNGVRDLDEAGVAGVAVSNGRDVVRTDETGAWELPANDDTAFFVIKPGGWVVPLDKHNTPRHFYLHKPGGSPELEVPGVPPTGPLPDSLDFPLQKRNEGHTFEMLLFGDPQARGMKEVNYIAHDVVEECIGTNAAFGLTLGDIVADDPGLFETINGIVAHINIPWYNVLGNHDTNRDAQTDAASDETFERVYGPSTYAFEYGDVCFIALDNVYVTAKGYEGRFTDNQLTFIKNYLSGVPAERLLVFAMHIPVVVCKNRQDFLGLFEGRPHTLSIAAHSHTMHNLFLGEEDGWHGKEPHHHFINATVCGSWWCGLLDEQMLPHATMNDGAPNGYTVVRFEGNAYRMRFKAARRPAGYQMNIYLPDEVTQQYAGNTEVLVNVFAGSSRSVVEMQMNGSGSWLPLEQTAAADPACLWMHSLSPYLDASVNGVVLDTVLGWKMDSPDETRHMWKGLLPPGLKPGIHRMTVRTRDMYGQEWTAERIMRVTD